MKILQVINKFGHGGASRLIRDFALEIKKNNVEIEFEVCLLNSKVNLYSSELQKEGIKIHEISLNIYDPRLLAWFRKKINNYDLIHVHLFPSFYWVGFASFIFRYSGYLVFTEHNTYNKRRKYALFRPIDRWIYNRYHKIICISNPVKKALCEWLPNLSNRSIVIENAIDIDRFLNANPTQISDIIGHSTDGLVLVLMAASFRGSKDQKTLVRAMKWLPEYYYLLLLGCGNKEQEIKAVTSNSNLDHRVRFLGFRKDIPEIMKACDIYVQSSWWEGFGLVAAEAMAAGLPVVASNVEGLSEVVGSSGLLFEPGNPEELAKKISEAFSEKKRLSILAREQVKKRFSINRFLEEHILLYQNLCNKTDF